MRDGRMRCAMVGCDARGNFHRASHPTIAPRIARCDFQRFSSRIDSRDEIFSDFRCAREKHRSSHRAMRCARETHRSSYRAMRCARGKHRSSHRAMRGAIFFPRASHRAMRGAMVGFDARWKFPRASHSTIAHRILPSRISSRIASYHRAKHRASHPTIAHRILPSHNFSRLHAWSFSAIITYYSHQQHADRKRIVSPESFTIVVNIVH